MANLTTLERDGREVILLTEREGTALLNFLELATTTLQRSDPGDFGRAYRVLTRQVTFLKKRQRSYTESGMAWR